ncbi:MAG: SDR family oxidoreductase, partial [Aliidongia sp.]
MPTRTAWVLGSSGFLGGAVGRRYVDLGWHVWGAGRPNHPIPEGYTGWMTGAVTETLLAEMAKRGTLPDLVFHGAGGARVGVAEADPQGDFEKSVESTRAVVEFLVRHKPDAAFVFPSSAAVYGSCDAGPIAETARCAAVSHYGRHKVLCEEICEIAARDHGLRSLVIRFFSVSGPGLRKQLLWDLGRQ